MNKEELRDAFISKAREYPCSVESGGKETNWKETYSNNYASRKFGRVNNGSLPGERVMVVVK